MKSVIFAATAVFGLAMAGAASADSHMEGLSADAEQFKAGCMAFQEEYGGETDCTCLAKTYDDDDDFAEEMMSIMGPEDLETLSDDSNEKIAACTEGM